MARPPVAKLAIIGTPSSGKSSLFSALTGIEYAKIVAAVEKPVQATVQVRDPRLIAHHGREPADKLVFPTLDVLDTAPFYTDEENRPNNVETFNVIREVDGYLAVIEAYLGPQTRETIRRSIENVKAELFLFDLDIMKKRIDRLEGIMKHPKRTDEDRLELEVLKHLFEEVSGGNTEPFRKLASEVQRRLRGFQFFSSKPILWVANVADKDLAAFSKETEFVALCGSLELELGGMSPAEQAEFLGAYGLTGLVTESLLRKAYSLLGFQTFFTIGEDENAGWGIRTGTTAWEAAGKIHKDIQRGFIAAEVLSYDELMKAGSFSAAKSKIRMEGKAYVVKDGEVVHFKFNV